MGKKKLGPCLVQQVQFPVVSMARTESRSHAQRMAAGSLVSHYHKNLGFLHKYFISLGKIPSRI